MSSMIKSLRCVLSKKLKDFAGLEECKMAIIVRTDIGMTKGKIASQCAHAAIECYRQSLASSKHKGLLTSWELCGQPKIVLRISSQNELDQLACIARSNNVITATIRDAGRTQLTPGTVSVLGIGPAPKIYIEKITASLKLL